MQVVRHWRPYLWGRSFLVRTDHYALKFMLDQRLSTIPQHHWISKLFGFDFQVEYKPGHLNIVADALSRRDAEEVFVHAISAPTFHIYDEVRQLQASSPAIVSLRADIEAGKLSAPWALQHGLVTRRRPGIFATRFHHCPDCSPDSSYSGS